MVRLTKGGLEADQEDTDMTIKNSLGKIAIGSIAAALLYGCTVVDKEPDTTIVNPPDTTIVKPPDNNVIVTPPSTGGGVSTTTG
ncbi:MAG: hypothetical protein H7Y17_06815 [Chlorobia bacterium]|nr:hypothetical protein [Fimbriimonadaceae bacterium]